MIVQLLVLIVDANTMPTYSSFPDAMQITQQQRGQVTVVLLKKNCGVIC